MIETNSWVFVWNFTVFQMAITQVSEMFHCMLYSVKLWKFMQQNNVPLNKKSEVYAVCVV